MAFDTYETLTQTEGGDELLPGTSLFYGQYEITRFINSGGFGITYLARNSVDREVVIKECFSSSFCRRTQSRVRPRSKNTEGHMDRIVKSFLNEARCLAKLKHPNIVGVHQVFEDNDTAYMAMDYIRGHDLQAIIDEKKVDLKPDQIVAIAVKLVSAIAYVHDNDLLHCDISPDNIFVTPEGEPILIDFGAARRNAVGAEQMYSGLNVVKDGYSPHELYATGGNSGPWSDVYALAASLYHAISGQAPPNCQSRLAALAMKETDPCKPLAGSVEGYPADFLEAIDKAMSVLPVARFQSAKDWAKALPQLPERGEKRVLLLRRVLPQDAANPAPVVANAPPEVAPIAAAVEPAVVAPVAPQLERPASARRPTTRVADVDISGLRRISGFIGGWLVDGQTGFILAGESAQDGVDLEATMTASIAVARANLDVLRRVELDDPIDDILITRGRQLHLIRPLEQSAKVFICVAVDTETANPGLARVQLRRVEQAVRL
ncbi:serine/threonine protein kinase [Tabrizicola sp.]|uniref:serine/threonine protein kinase n=1 Tax=Tabrizicola sp. TaxID=2005166 RepID=UPI003F3F6AB2